MAGVTPAMFTLLAHFQKEHKEQENTSIQKISN
jgi:hypothetical protein